MTPTEELQDLCADLVSLKRLSPFVGRLFRTAAGEWVALPSLCAGLEEIEARFAQVCEEAPAAQELTVTWLPYAPSAYGEGYALLLFVCPALKWHTIALYNHHRFLRAAAAGLEGL